tara:strand:- start:413 stop:967 length:555 start_codon:yes stop_codon:yes gene_type:complete
MKIAITGNIGSGKSEAVKFLSLIGYRCISSDQIIKTLYQNDQSRNYILKRIGVNNKNYKEEIIKRLVDPVFNKNLKKVIYPLLYAKKKMVAPKFSQYNPIFYEVPLLFEEMLSRDFDYSICVSATPTKRKQRILSRGSSVNYFNLMNRKQLRESIKENLSNFTINNNGSILNLRLNIIKLLHKL